MSYAGAVFSEDFTTDPQWPSTEPSNVKWDSGGFYRARVTDNPSGFAQWGYSPVFQEISNSTFTVEFDMRPVSPAFGTYPVITFIKEGVENPYRDASLLVSAHWDWMRYKIFRFNSPALNSLGESATFDSSKWYHHTIAYNSDNSVLTWDVYVRELGTTFHNGVYNNISLTPFNQVAIGYRSEEPVYGSWAEIYVDNIEVIPEPTTVLLFGLGGLALRRKCRAK